MNRTLDERDDVLLALVSTVAIVVVLFLVLLFQSVSKSEPPQVKEEPVIQQEQALEEDVLIDAAQLIQQNNANQAKNMVRDTNDQRKASDQDFSQNIPSGDAYQNIKDFERQLFEESGGAAVRDKILSEAGNKVKDKNEKPQNSGNSTNSNSGTNTKYSGEVMVDFSVPGRSAYENNNWWVRNPGYTCGYGASGKVVVNVVVNQSGRVIQADIDLAASRNPTECMKQQALTYAKKSRFNENLTGASKVNGWIAYKFIAQ